jgi:GH24 family phage-related lysozyme (muramidase)
MTSKKYTIQLESRSFKTLATGAMVGAAAFGGIVAGANLAGVGRYAPKAPQGIVQQPPVANQAPVEQKKDTEEKKVEPVERVDIHPDTLEFMKKHEGFRPNAYWDYKQFSVGYGSGTHTDGKPVSKNTKVTEEQAHDMMVHHIKNRIIPKVEKYSIWEKMNDNERGGFTSFLYNVGEHVIGSKNHPTINSAIHSGDVRKVYDAMALYNKVTDSKGNRSVSRGLQARREAERKHAFGE